MEFNPNHGGQLKAAAHHFGIALDRWVDLSTGINPHCWPVPPIPERVWRQLPDDCHSLLAQARDYYQCQHLLPLAGSQAAINLLPTLRGPSNVVVADESYNEHQQQWQRAGHSLHPTDRAELNRWQPSGQLPDFIDVLIIINPNNPTGHRVPPETLLKWHQQLRKKNGWLIVDEAFMDGTPEQSIATHTGPDGLLVLKSLGKFFGLAGIRCGFLSGPPTLLEQLSQQLGPWSLSHPAQWIAEQALADTYWQQQTRIELQRLGEQLNQLMQQTLQPLSQQPVVGCNLFQSIPLPKRQASSLQQFLGERGLLIRYFEHSGRVRIGLPGNPQQWQKLTVGLTDFANQHR